MSERQLFTATETGVGTIFAPGGPASQWAPQDGSEVLDVVWDEMGRALEIVFAFSDL
jgi:hypothetical protein